MMTFTVIFFVFFVYYSQVGQSKADVGNPNSNAYSMYDAIAQATCLAASDAPGYVYAIRRDCAKKKTCNKLCSALSKSTTCFDMVSISGFPSVFPQHAAVQGKKGITAYRYFYQGCKSNGCGGNFCCCRG